MSQTEITKTQKDEFMDYVSNKLNGIGFTKTDNIWEKIIRQQSSSTRINMNGVERIIPGKERIVNIKVEIDGDGALIENDKETPFTQFSFSITEDEVTQQMGPIWCLYYDDQLLFDSILKNYFNVEI